MIQNRLERISKEGVIYKAETVCRCAYSKFNRIERFFVGFFFAELKYNFIKDYTQRFINETHGD